MGSQWSWSLSTGVKLESIWGDSVRESNENPESQNTLIKANDDKNVQVYSSIKRISMNDQIYRLDPIEGRNEVRQLSPNGK